jgi:anaerobic magnesium-protoporphyrin IX monomethyl ester cyclase
MKTKILFINAIDVSDDTETSFPPLGLAYLVGSLREKFGAGQIEARIISAGVEREITDFRPDIVGISAVSQNYGRAAGYASLAKKYHLPVLFGGVHISMLQSSLTRDMDAGVVGEGERTVCELVGLFREKGGFPAAGLKLIKGILFWDDGQISATERREPVVPLDSLPLPARDLLDIRKMTYMFTSRGCLYRCAFCASSRFWGKMRSFSAEYTAAEIVELVERRGVEEIRFLDDFFSADTGRVRGILAILKRRGLLGRVKFSCSIRADQVNEEIVGLLKELGVYSIGMGLESGCKESLDYLKGGVTVEENYKAVRTIKAAGLLSHGSFVIGSPREDKKDILKTLEFIKKSGVDSFGVYVLTPFPGTPVWEYALSRGLVGQDMQWERLNVNFSRSHERLVILSEKLTREEIYGLWLRFERYRMSVRILELVRLGLRKPWRIPGFFLKKLYGNTKSGAD